MAIANITLHFIMLANIYKVLLIKRFVDDIVFISESKKNSSEIIKSLTDTFEKHNLKITSNTMSTELKIILFLDVEHVFNTENEIKSFKSKRFIKETAKHSTFLNGRSYHSQNVFKWIITGEVKRLIDWMKMKF